jgi:hypothetical protein
MTLWESRDLPVLRALATTDDDHVRAGFLFLREQQTDVLRIGLTGAEVYEATLALADADYITCLLDNEAPGRAAFTRLRVTGRGQQALGEWPLFDHIASPETLALLLERLAETATDEEATNLRRAASYARRIGGASLRAAATGVLAQLARVAVGLG